MNTTFNTTPLPGSGGEQITRDDAAWILSNAFLILTMQTGFGMLEAGCVQSKNVANIMVKNVIDVTMGGITYWAFGYALSFGRPCNWFLGYGDFFFSPSIEQGLGTHYARYVFQFSFATAATTIVSGAVAERMKLTTYTIFSALNTFVYCIPASWAWNDVGFLRTRGFFDFAGACVVHMCGGVSALVAAKMLGPRMGKFSQKDVTDDYDQMSSPVTALTGTFMLWWAWLAFNCGSSFGLSGNLWKISAKVGVTTLNGSIGGSMMGLFLSLAFNWKHKYFDIPYIINSVLGGLVGITAACAVISPAEALLIGAIGGAIGIGGTKIMNWIKVDDPVGAVPVHLMAATWATVAVGLFGKDDFGLLSGYNGVFHGGGFYLLGIQCAGCACVIVWSGISTFLCFGLLKVTFGIRMSVQDEILGADWTEHRIRSENFADKLEKSIRAMEIGVEEMDDVAHKVLEQLNSGRPKSGTRMNNIGDSGQGIRNFAGGNSSNFGEIFSAASSIVSDQHTANATQKTPNITEPTDAHTDFNSTPAAKTDVLNAKKVKRGSLKQRFLQKANKSLVVPAESKNGKISVISYQDLETWD